MTLIQRKRNSEPSVRRAEERSDFRHLFSRCRNMAEGASLFRPTTLLHQRRLGLVEVDAFDAGAAGEDAEILRDGAALDAGHEIGRYLVLDRLERQLAPGELAIEADEMEAVAGLDRARADLALLEIEEE